MQYGIPAWLENKKDQAGCRKGSFLFIFAELWAHRDQFGLKFSASFKY